MKTFAIIWLIFTAVVCFITIALQVQKTKTGWGGALVLLFGLIQELVLVWTTIFLWQH